MTQMVRKLDRDARMPGGASDPIFSAIARHVTARAACADLDDGVDEEAYEVAHAARRQALIMVESAQPTTLPGLLALASHIDDYMMEGYGAGRYSDGYSDGTDQGNALRGLINACYNLGKHVRPRDGTQLAIEV